MADTKISDLTDIGSGAAGTDVLAIVDSGPLTTKKVTVANLVSATTVAAADGLIGANNLSDVDTAATALSNIGGIGAATSDTLTNKTFDANGTGNSLSNVDVADLANGTDGELITWDASGVPAAVAVGTSTQVLTSNGVGAAPTFQDGGGSTIGVHTIWVPASAMVPTTTNGAEKNTTELGSNDVMVDTMDFDATTLELAQFSIRMPKSQASATLTYTAVFVWSHAATTTNFGIYFTLKAKSQGNSALIDSAWGTGVGNGDAGGTTDSIYITGATGAITASAGPAKQEYVSFQVYREVAQGSDTMAIDARLHGISLYYTTDAENDD